MKVISANRELRGTVCALAGLVSADIDGLLITDEEQAETLDDMMTAAKRVVVCYRSDTYTASDVHRRLSAVCDDYVCMKYPFAYERFISVLTDKTSDAASAPSVRDDDIVLSARDFSVSWSEYRINLTPSEFRILNLLYISSGETVSREMLKEALPGEGEGNSVDVHIASLRRKTSAMPFAVTSVRGVGYMLTRK